MMMADWRCRGEAGRRVAEDLEIGDQPLEVILGRGGRQLSSSSTSRRVFHLGSLHAFQVHVSNNLRGRTARHNEEPG